jgi:hypothetical protein
MNEELDHAFVSAPGTRKRNQNCRCCGEGVERTGMLGSQLYPPRKF